jgi:transcriptional regulator with XRE-family HTH domain
MNVEVANKLVKLRKKYGYSQEQLAEKIGVSRQAVSKWERSESSPDTDNLIALAKIYNLSIDEMLNYNINETATQNSTGEKQTIIANTDVSSSNVNKYIRRIPIPVVATLIYLILGFVFDLWHPGWLVFMLVPIWYTIFPNWNKE